MEALQSILLGLIQGLTEFLPVSSSGHLTIFNVLFGRTEGEEIVAFNLLLHLGTLIAVFIVYYKDIFTLIKSALSLLKKLFTGRLFKEGAEGEEKFVLWVCVATLPLVAVKLLGLDELVEFMSSNMLAVGIILLINGAVLFFSDMFARGKRAVNEIKWYNALAVGLCQMCAILPGLSRSGSTITGGLLNGLDRNQAVRFSFILSIPAILGASVFDVPKLFTSSTTPTELLIYIVATAVSAIVGIGAMRLLNFISKHSNFRLFSYYCWVVGIIVIIISFFR